MSTPRQQKSGLPKTSKSQASRQKHVQKAAEHTNKEQRAVELINQGKLQEAEAIYRELIEEGTNNYIVFYNLAKLCRMQGKFNELINLLRQALELKPNYPEAHNNLGVSLQEQGDLTAAIDSYKSALQLNPNYPDAHLNLGNAFQQQGDLTAAIDSYNSALQLNPNHPDAHLNLGNALRDQGDLTAAIDSYNSALQLNPNHPEAHNNLGVALQEQDDLTAAIDSYNSALQLNPNHPDAHNNLGTAFQQQGDLTAAIDSYNSALQLNPNHPEANQNLSMAELLAGDYKNGWKRYEYRFQSKKNQVILNANPSCKQWNGEALVQGEKLLLIHEQGLGDTLQFMRYATALRNQGISVSFCAQPKLHALIQASGIDPSPLTPEQANQVGDEKWIPLLSVPRYLEVSPENPIITEPYIKTTKEFHTKWSEILSAEQQPIIGINWQGNPKIEKTGTGFWGRSLALETFAPVANCSHISLLSLQKGFGSEQLATCSFKERFVSCQDQVDGTWDFLETAAMIANCDLIITSDTSVAHLAGGMGKTTWLLLHKVPDWRWGLEGDTTFWYPSMRLFRQKERGNWHEVMERVAEALKAHFEHLSAPNQPAAAPQPATKLEPIQNILAPISLGELIDKITILEIKTQNLQGTALENVKKELEALKSTLNDLQLNIDTTLFQRLKEVNQNLWQIEDDIRDQERQKSFGDTFIRLARSVYQQNDHRAAIKKEINTTYGSGLVEEKSYQQY